MNTDRGRSTTVSTILRKGIVRGGQVVIDEPLNLPDGSEVTILGRSLDERPGRLSDIDFMTEDAQSDDPVAVQQWIDDLRSIPPVPEDPVKEAEWRVWEERMRQFNLEAVRKQFEEGPP
jgi:hypothetical protein